MREHEPVAWHEGRPSRGARQAAPYGGGPIRFFQLLADWRAEEKFEGLELGT